MISALLFARLQLLGQLFRGPLFLRRSLGGHLQRAPHLLLPSHRVGVPVSGYYLNFKDARQAECAAFLRDRPAATRRTVLQLADPDPELQTLQRVFYAVDSRHGFSEGNAFSTDSFFATVARGLHMTSLRTGGIDGGSLTAAHEQQASAQQTKPSISELRGFKPGSRVCLMSDSARRGVLESQAPKGFWAVRFADKSRNIRVNDLKLLPSDAASFEPSQAPLSASERQQEKKASATESSKRGLPVAASAKKCADFQPLLWQAHRGPRLPRE